MLRATCCRQQVVHNKQLVASGNMLHATSCADEQHAADNKQLLARNMLLVRATCCRTCCAGVNAALACVAVKLFCDYLK